MYENEKNNSVIQSDVNSMLFNIAERIKIFTA